MAANDAVKAAALDLTPAERIVGTVESLPRPDAITPKQTEFANFERALEEARRERPALQELAAEARRVLDTALVRSRAKPSAEANAQLDEARALVRQTDDRITENVRAVQLLEGEAARLRSELEALERAAHGRRRAHVLERLQHGAPERRERLLEDLVAEALTTQLIAGVPPSDAGRICATALGEKLMAIGYQAEQLFNRLAKEVES